MKKRIGRRWWGASVAVLAGALVALPAVAAVPTTISQQGRLYDANQRPFAADQRLWVPEDGTTFAGWAPPSVPRDRAGR